MELELILDLPGVHSVLMAQLIGPALRRERLLHFKFHKPSFPMIFPTVQLWILLDMVPHLCDERVVASSEPDELLSPSLYDEKKTHDEKKKKDLCQPGSELARLGQQKDELVDPLKIDQRRLVVAQLALKPHLHQMGLELPYLCHPTIIIISSSKLGRSRSTASYDDSICKKDNWPL